MARTNINPITVPSLPIGAGLATYTPTAADVANGNAAAFPSTSARLQLIAQNTDATSRNVTITSAPDALGRTGDIGPYALPAGAIAIFPPFTRNGWQQSDLNLYFSADNALVKFIVIAL
jgi:hypothetical protein